MVKPIAIIKKLKKGGSSRRKNSVINEPSSMQLSSGFIANEVSSMASRPSVVVRA